MPCKSFVTSIIALLIAGGLTTAGCGSDSPTSPPATQPPAPPAPPAPPPSVSRIEISPDAASLEVGKTQEFVATAKASDGAVISGVSFTWSSSNTAVATISSGGVATAFSTGTATIRANGNGITSEPATVTVTRAPVAGAPVASITVSPSAPQQMTGDDTRQLMAVARTSDGTMVGGVAFVWSSDDNEVATVDSTGLITAVAAGMANITATAEEVTSEPVIITVAEPPPPPPPPVVDRVVDRVTVEPTTASIQEGDTRQFSATAYDADNAEITGKTFIWESSSTSVAAVDAMGLATGVSAGPATITATVDEVSGTASLTVTEPPPPPMRSRTAAISGTSSYPRTAGAVTFEEVAGGKLKLTITGMNTGGGVAAHLFLYTSASINWRSGPAPDGARHFGNVTNRNSFSQTFTPRAGETIDSYSDVILHCAFVNMKLGSGSLSN